ncbi:MAG: hypothetical protein B7Y54_08505 [Polaromonas sp. 35-63-240]|nr:MAG: hypothetical protein B7Y54_08505 [Polaromonas sp. 35-63-240]OYY95136.1 MAG: hypothetical protein B7Y42_10940 [Polaromonas sp. 28-63-22]
MPARPVGKTPALVSWGNVSKRIKGHAFTFAINVAIQGIGRGFIAAARRAARPPRRAQSQA